MNKFSLLLSLSFFMVSIADLQAYRGQEIVNKGLAKGSELLEFVKSSKKAQIGLGVAAGILVLKVIASKRKSLQLEQNDATQADKRSGESDGFRPALTRDQKRQAKRKAARAAKQDTNRKKTD